jgi:hypothetical protein
MSNWKTKTFIKEKPNYFTNTDMTNSYKMLLYELNNPNPQKFIVNNEKKIEKKIPISITDNIAKYCYFIKINEPNYIYMYMYRKIISIIISNMHSKKKLIIYDNNIHCKYNSFINNEYVK